MKILIFTDSRGQHKKKKSFKNKLIFTEKLKKELEKNKNNQVNLILCPYKWTTTFDFIELCLNEIINVDDYDLIVLYTGIVEFSPRPMNQVINLLYNNNKNQTLTTDDILDNKKVGLVNKKKITIDKLIGEENIKKYFNEPFSTKYKMEHTMNLLSVEMFENKIIKWLKENLGNKLIYINCNNIVKNWEGDYKNINAKGRPANISLISNYSKITEKKLSKNIINLLEWTDEDIKKYTIDNMHLTYSGSEWIYNKLIDKIQELATSE